MTPQRLAIIDVLIESKDFDPGARFVYDEAKKKKKSLSLSTTYSTLNELPALVLSKYCNLTGWKTVAK